MAAYTINLYCRFVAARDATGLLRFYDSGNTEIADTTAVMALYRGEAVNIVVNVKNAAGAAVDLTALTPTPTAFKLSGKDPAAMSGDFLWTAASGGAAESLATGVIAFDDVNFNTNEFNTFLNTQVGTSRKYGQDKVFALEMIDNTAGSEVAIYCQGIATARRDLHRSTENAPIYANLVHNTAATADPTATDDVDSGYGTGSIWINTTDNTLWRCLDNSDDAAIWTRVDLDTVVVRLKATGNVDESTELENADTIDGVAVATDDLVWLADQSTATEDGIYEAVASGAASRWAGMPAGMQVAGLLVVVLEGTANSGLWYIADTSSVVGTDGQAPVRLVEASEIAGFLSNIVEDTTPQLGGALDTNSFAVNHSKGADLASAGTVNIGGATDGNAIDITGTTTITAFDSVTAGIKRTLQFDGILTLTHNASSLILPGGANITTAAGDTCEMMSLGSGNWKCNWYQRANGTILGTLAASDISNTPAGNIAATDVQAAIDELDTEKLALAGGTMTGDINLNGVASILNALVMDFAAANEKTVATGVLTVDQALTKVQPESGTADDIDTISGLAVGQIGFLRASDVGTDTLTLKHGTGNISIVGGNDLAFSEGAVLVWSDGTTVYAIGGGGSGDVTAASSFGTDNVLVRSDGTGKGVQASGISVDDNDNVDGISFLTLLDEEELTVSSGAITPTQSACKVLGEGAAADDLATINATSTSRVLFLRPSDAGQDITLKHGTGNIVTPTAADYTIPDNGFVVLVYDGSNWRVQGAPATGASDSNAIHDNTSGEIAAVTAKATPTTSDYLLIEDAAASNAKKSITIGDLTQAILPTTMFVPASAFTPRATNGMAPTTEEFATNDVNLDYLLADGATEEYADALIEFPSSWDGGTITCKVFWDGSTGATATDTVEWEVGGRAYANDDAIDQAAGTTQVISDALLAVGDMHITSATPSITLGGSPAAGQPVRLTVSRNVSGTDDMTEDAKFFGLEITFSNS